MAGRPNARQWVAVWRRMLIAERTGIDLPSAAADKIGANDAKYPADKVRGRAAKYTEL